MHVNKLFGKSMNKQLLYKYTDKFTNSYGMHICIKYKIHTFLLHHKSVCNLVFIIFANKLKACNICFSFYVTLNSIANN